MKDIIYINSLYDYYSCLLTEKQKLYFEDYYFHNLSLAEISKNNDVSRNAIYKQLKIIEKKLVDLESKLKLFEKGKKIKKLIKDFDPIIKDKIKKLM